MKDKKILEVTNLKKYFPIKRGVFGKISGYVKAVDDVSFYINEGETLGLVGESGCGKTTIAKTILRALNPDEGDIFMNLNDEFVNIAKLPKNQLKNLRKNIQMIFQNPFTSLNPRMKVKDIIGEPLFVNKIAKGKELESIVEELIGYGRFKKGIFD